MITRVLAWLPALAWACLIWGFGSDGFSEPATSRILDPLLAWLLPGLSDETRALWVWSIRRLAHPIEYGVLGVLCLHGVRLSWPGAAGREARRALVPVLAIALADETRQALSSIRTGSLLDAFFDVAGAALALAALVWIERRLGVRLAGRRRARD